MNQIITILPLQTPKIFPWYENLDFISKNKKGAHPEQFLQDLKGGFQDVEDTYGKDLSNVDIITSKLNGFIYMF